MKRILLAGLLLSLALTIEAQNGTMLWDGESWNIGSRGGCWDDGSPTVVANPDKGGINPSDKCLKFTMTNGNKIVKIPFRDWVKPGMNGSRRFSLMIRKPVNENVRIEVSDPTDGRGGYWQKVAAQYTGGGGWQLLVFDFQRNDDFDYPGVISITAQTGYVASSQDVYIDNVRIEGPTRVNGQNPADLAGGSLRGHLTLTGSWAAGTSINANNDSHWDEFYYDDFRLLAPKLTAHVTSADLRSASVVDGCNIFRLANPNALVFANTYFNRAADGHPGTRGWVYTEETGRNSIYFQPQYGFVGDPVPFYDPSAGKFRIMYLAEFRPNPATFHPFHQATTTSFTSYDFLGVSIPCGSTDSQEHSLGTGSVVQKNGIYYCFYTGHNDDYNYYTNPAHKKEVVLRATSADGEHWTKDGSFRLESPLGSAPHDYDANEFRDPHVFQDGGQWHMVVSAVMNSRPCVAHFTSTDLNTWTLQTPLLSGMDSFYECIDIFRMGSGKYYMVFSKMTDKRVYYRSSSSLTGTWSDPVALDGASFYASKTVADAWDRYLMGWCPTRPGNDNTAPFDWAGSLVVHKLYEQSAGRLALTLPHTIEQHFSISQPVDVTEATMNAGDHLQLDRLQYQNLLSMTITATSNTNEVFGLSFVDNDNTDARYTVRINLESQMIYFNKDLKAGGVSEINKMTLPRSGDGKYRIRVCSEQSVCVVYVNDHVAFTNRIYGLARNPLSIFCENGTVRMEDLKVKTY